MRPLIFALAFVACNAATLPLEVRDSVIVPQTTDLSILGSDDKLSHKNVANVHARKLILKHTTETPTHRHLPRCVSAIIPNGGFDTAADGKSSASGVGGLSTAALAIAIAVLVV
ncbi:hypothetical protein F4774DRAFT_407889 [Daldinia eschscholtzii]|nr:hypothetical protein F4774DRAFT_407889 [Daldinia eschscholtzii]